MVEELDTGSSWNGVIEVEDDDLGRKGGYDRHELVDGAQHTPDTARSKAEVSPAAKGGRRCGRSRPEIPRVDPREEHGCVDTCDGPRDLDAIHL